MIVLANAHNTGDPNAAYNDAIRRIDKVVVALGNPLQYAPVEATGTNATLESNISQEQYEANVRKAKDYIKDGDAFQIVLSRRLEVSPAPDPFRTYRFLRALNRNAGNVGDLLDECLVKRRWMSRFALTSPCNLVSVACVPSGVGCPCSGPVSMRNWCTSTCHTGGRVGSGVSASKRRWHVVRTARIAGCEATSSVMGENQRATPPLSAL